MLASILTAASAAQVAWFVCGLSSSNIAGLSNPSPSSQASLYFVLLVVLGNFVVINVFLAIAVESLEAMREVVDELNEIEARDNEAHEERPDPVVGSFLAPPHKHPFPFSKRAKSYDN